MKKRPTINPDTRCAKNIGHTMADHGVDPKCLLDLIEASGRVGALPMAHFWFDCWTACMVAGGKA